MLRIMTRIGFVLAALQVTPGLAFGQDETTEPTIDTSTLEPSEDFVSVIDEDPIPSPRGAGMANALSTTSDDLDAAFHNPAGIGGLNLNKKSNNWVRKLYFPWSSISANRNSSELYQDVKKEGGSTDSTIGKAIIDAHAGERQYARASVVAGMVIGRTMVVPFTDMQVAATSHGEGSNLVDMRYASTAGVGAGFSAQDKDGRFSLGYFGYTAKRAETYGTFLYDDVIDAERRKEVIKDNTVNYTGTGHNAGFIWKMGKNASPSLGVAMKNAGDTKFKAQKGGEDLVVKQDLSVGFSVSPQLGKASWANLVLEATDLTEPEVSLVEKYRLGTELLLDGFGSYATFGLRAGYQYAGPSAGFSLNLGLVGLEASVYSVDVGAGNEKVPEQRGVVAIYVNVADF